VEERLLRMRYTREGNTFVKPLGEYRIMLFPNDTGFIRRIMLNGQLVDIRRVTINNLENDNVIKKIVKDMPDDIRLTPRIITDNSVIINDDDIADEDAIRVPIRDSEGNVRWIKQVAPKEPVRDWLGRIE
jgi:hypothetical protein